MFGKMLSKIKEKSASEKKPQLHQTVKAHKIGDASLTITTVILVLISLHFGVQFAPFIILLMSSRIGASIYTVIKTTSKREMGKLALWCALFLKSAVSCWQFLIPVV